jgi:hypothetical protein
MAQPRQTLSLRPIRRRRTGKARPKAVRDLRQHIRGATIDLGKQPPMLRIIPAVIIRRQAAPPGGLRPIGESRAVPGSFRLYQELLSGISPGRRK